MRAALNFIHRRDALNACCFIYTVAYTYGFNRYVLDTLWIQHSYSN